MPNIDLTEKLRSTIKELRKTKKKRGDELSREIGKGAAYISQLENGKIKEIDFDLLNDIFHRITDLSGEEYQKFLDELLDDTISHMTPKELQHEKWMHQFNHEIRKFPITDGLIDFIKEKLEELNYTPEEFVDIINKNRGLDDNDELIEVNKLKIEVIDTGDGGYAVRSSIRFELPSDFIKKILAKETRSINYINMQGILFNLFLSDSYTVEDAFSATDDILYQNHFYTIDDREKLINETFKKKKANKEDFNFYDIQPTDYDKEYQKLKRDIMNGLDFLRDKDIMYACERLKTFSKNMHDDLGFITAIMSIPLHRIDDTLKKDFWNEYQNLVKTYIDKSSDSKNQ